MHRLRNSILYLVIHLAIFFNIDRLDVAGKMNVLSLEKTIFALSMIAVIMILSIQWLRTLQPQIAIPLWTAAYFVAKLMLLSRRPLIGGIYTYLSFMELGLFLIAVVLAQKLALNIQDFEKALENFTFANVFKIKAIQEAQRDIQSEIYRSRRFRRPLSIIVLEQNPKKTQANFNRIVQESQRALMEQYTFVTMVKEVAAQLRLTDMLLEYDRKGRLIVISPDTDDTGAEAFMARLKSLTQSAAFSVNFGVASFPQQALTFEQLLECAEENLRQRAGNLASMNAVGKSIDSSEVAAKEVKVD